MINHPSSNLYFFRRAIRSPGLALLAALASINLFVGTSEAMESTIPKVGDQAPSFALHTLDDKPVDLDSIGRDKKVILVVLRGWPGYQCPFCTTQVYEYVGHAADFAAGNFQIVMVYPGPADQLRQHAADFLQDKR